MKLPAPDRLLRLAAVLTLIGLLLMLWSMFVPTPMPVILAMSVGQLLGTVAFALYGFVVLQDLRITRRARRTQSTGSTQPAGSTKSAESSQSAGSTRSAGVTQSTGFTQSAGSEESTEASQSPRSPQPSGRLPEAPSGKVAP
jgi:hypothetical protein